MRSPAILLAVVAAPSLAAGQTHPDPAATPAPAMRGQAPPGPSSAGTVVVTGRRAPDRKVVEHLTRAITRVDADDHVARFPDAVCPMSDGMPLDYDSRLAARIRADAAAAGIRLDPPGCRPNIVVTLIVGRRRRAPGRTLTDNLPITNRMH